MINNETERERKEEKCRERKRDMQGEKK